MVVIHFFLLEVIRVILTNVTLIFLMEVVRVTLPLPRPTAAWCGTHCAPFQLLILSFCAFTADFSLLCLSTQFGQRLPLVSFLPGISIQNQNVFFLLSHICAFLFLLFPHDSPPLTFLFVFIHDFTPETLKIPHKYSKIS